MRAFKTLVVFSAFWVWFVIGAAMFNLLAAITFSIDWYNLGPLTPWESDSTLVAAGILVFASMVMFLISLFEKDQLWPMRMVSSLGFTVAIQFQFYLGLFSYGDPGAASHSTYLIGSGAAIAVAVGSVACALARLLRLPREDGNEGE